METQPMDPMAKSREILANLAVRKAGETSPTLTARDAFYDESPARSMRIQVSEDPFATPRTFDADEAETDEGSPNVWSRIKDDEAAQKNTLSSLSAYVERTLSSLEMRLDAVESRFIEGGILGVSTQSSAALVQELVAERCLIVRQELETKYASLAASSTLLQRKLDVAVSKLNNELDANRKDWKEEAIRLWEAVDTHTHEVNVGAGSDSMAASMHNLHEVQSENGTESPPSMNNDSSLEMGRITLGSVRSPSGLVQSDSPRDRRRSPRDSGETTVAQSSLNATTVTLVTPSQGELMVPSGRSPTQVFRSVPHPGDRSPPRQHSPPAQLRVTQQQGGGSVSLSGGQMTPGHQIRWAQPQQAATSVVRARSFSPGVQPISMVKVTDGAGSPQRPAILPPKVATLPLASSSTPSVPGVRAPQPTRRTAPEVTLSPLVDDSGMTVFSRRMTGPPTTSKGAPTPINSNRKTVSNIGGVGAWALPASQQSAQFRVRKPEG